MDDTDTTKDKLELLRDDLKRSHKKPNSRSVELISGVVTVLTEQTEFLGILERLLFKMKVFTDVIDEVSKVCSVLPASSAPLSTAFNETRFIPI